MNINYISIKQVLDSLLLHPLLLEVTLERAIAYTVDFFRIVGMPDIFEEKVGTVTIENYRGKLPDDLYQIIQVREASTKKTFRYTTDSFHLANQGVSTELTYKVLNSVIYTTLQDGEIEIAYRAFVVDEEGYPMVPDNSTFTKALELYIKKQVFTILFDLGKIQGPILQQTQQDYAWAVGQAKNDMIIPTMDEMQSITNAWNSLLPRRKEHQLGFINYGTVEHLKKH